MAISIECKLGLEFYNQNNYAQAKNYWEQAAANQEAAAYAYLGRLYTHGKGVTQDHKQALEYYLQAIKIEENPLALNNLGTMHERGDEVERDYSSAINYYRQAAVHNYPIAIINLGKMYENGFGVTQDHLIARECYQKALYLGHTPANEYLTELYKKIETNYSYQNRQKFFAHIYTNYGACVLKNSDKLQNDTYKSFNPM